MENALPLKPKWGLTQEAFDKFLTCLDADRERAGLDYERIRAKLITFFQCRGCSFAEDHADEAINRVVRKIGDGELIREPHTYVFGVARMLYLEIGKAREKQRAAYEELPLTISNAEELEASEMRIECLKACLDGLPPEGRLLITEYYQGEKRLKIEHRKRLSDEMAIPLNALRIRAHRLREKLTSCVERCVAKA